MRDEDKPKKWWFDFWILAAAVLAVMAWFLPPPVGPVSSGGFASIVALWIIVQLPGDITMVGITKIIVKTGGINLAMWVVLLTLLASWATASHAALQESSPILLFLLGVWAAMSFWLIFLAYPLAFHWKELSRKAREELGMENKPE